MPPPMRLTFQGCPVTLPTRHDAIEEIARLAISTGGRVPAVRATDLPGSSRPAEYGVTPFSPPTPSFSIEEQLDGN